MKRSVTVLLSTCALALGVASTASAEAKIGVVNTQRLLNEAPQAKAAADLLRNEFAPREKDLQTTQVALKAREDKLTKDAATMSEIQKSSADKELRDGYRDLQRKQSEVQDDLNARRNEEMSKLQRVLADEITAFAKAQGYDIIFSDGVIYATNAYDVTGPILAALQNRKPGAAAAAPATAPPAKPAAPAAKP